VKSSVPISIEGNRVAPDLLREDLVERRPATKSSASVRFGAQPVSHVPVLTACVPCSGRSTFDTTVTRSRKPSIGFRMGLNSKPTPVVGGVQWLGRSPIGTNTAPNRLSGRGRGPRRREGRQPWRRAAAVQRGANATKHRPTRR
jgi:hypothetical protein